MDVSDEWGQVEISSHGRRRTCQAYHPAHVAQGIEQLPSKQSVAGSNPAVGTNTHNHEQRNYRAP